MGEAFAWSEGQLVLYTGSHAPVTSAVVAYVKSVNGNMVRGWQNREAMNREYYNVFTGQRADISFGAAYTYGAAALKVLESATAVHMKLHHNISGQGSGGYFFYSGVFDSLAINGMDNGVFEWTISYHANVWSAY
jgi:hypothetical protein